ncbi:MAG: polysaccharide deacetylase family protein, partial [Clostridia bacterium]
KSKKVNVHIDSSNLDTKAPGTYTVKYSARNLKGKKEVTDTRKVIVVDKVPPKISLNGEIEVSITEGDTYVELGAKAIDDVDLDVSDKIIIDTNLNTAVKGKYTVKYSATDKSLNAAEATRTVTVLEKPKPKNVKTIYLTFDDGPSKVTPALLDMLKKNNVKATFFVIGSQLDGYRDVVKRASDEGHAIYIHCYYHNYKEIYSSSENFFKDIEATRAKIKEITGKDVNIFRFAGGSSNTVSRGINKGIMSRLVKESIDRGYSYFDWNVDSRDASGNISSYLISKNLIQGTNIYTNTVVPLMHDASAKTSTIAGAEAYIRYCKDMGYAFDLISRDTMQVRHGVAN